MYSVTKYILVYLYSGLWLSKRIFTVKASLLNLRLPANEVDWVATIGSDAHEPNLGYKGMNDLFAIDLGRSGNADRNMPVYPVAPGQVVVSDNDWRFVMIKHTTPLALGDGTVLTEWYSGYMHMSGIYQYNLHVDTNTIIGNISNVEDRTKYNVTDHLHFAIYTGDYRYLSQMKSIDIANNLYGLTGPIIRWDEWCSNTSNPTHYFSNHWWSLNTAPCSYY
jgi:murein DD-endopeptidase MepM/ murein hydrolase activator NlpD